jgi:unsaturated chondroitin disaccharide hydrolase
MKRILVVGFVLLSCYCSAQSINTKKVFLDAAKQAYTMNVDLMANAVEFMDKVDSVYHLSPRTIENGKLKVVPSSDWTSGFYAGISWLLADYFQDKSYESSARLLNTYLEREKYNGRTHDMGFKIYCSFGNGYRLTKDEHYKEVIIQSARTLITRFNEKAGVIRSWDHHKEVWDYPVIIDNMMNLELLFEATKLTGDSTFYKVAVSHANTTMKNHFRADGSCYHVVDYDTATGNVIKKTTHQGYANESSWSRGQAWAVYGYTMCYRFTRDKRFLQQAEKTAAFMLNHPHMPKDGVPYWDYDAPNTPNEERDASAAAVLSSALFELSKYSSNGETLLQKANWILSSLVNNYRAPIGSNFGFILLHSTGSRPSKSEVDVPLIYADYYFLEALLRREGKLSYN